MFLVAGRYRFQMTHAIATSIDGNIGWLYLDKPERRNAISSAMWQAVPQAISSLSANRQIRVIILSGRGEHFAAGADISEFATVYANRQSSAAYAALMAAAMSALAECRQPTIAMIDGFCIGGGIALATCCDLRFATDRAMFAITPSRLGLVYSFEDTRRLVNVVGVSAAKDLLFSGRKLGTQEAVRIGLVDRAFPPKTCLGETMANAAQIAAGARNSIETAKRFVGLAVGGQVGETLQTHAAYLDAVEGAEFAEGRTAFLQKRRPDFQG